MRNRTLLAAADVNVLEQLEKADGIETVNVIARLLNLGVVAVLESAFALQEMGLCTVSEHVNVGAIVVEINKDHPLNLWIARLHR